MSTLEYDLATGLPKKKATKPAAPFVPFPTINPGDAPDGFRPPITLPGLQPVDYTSLINEQMKPLLDYQNQQQGFDRAGLTAARQRALATFGFVPDFGSMDKSFLAGLNANGAAPDISGDVTDQVRQLAQQNTADGLSTQARLDRANQDALRQIKNALASRGLLRGGETGYQVGRQQQAYKEANADATTKLLDYLAGVSKAYADAEAQRAQARLTAQQAAAEAAGKAGAAVPAFHGTWEGMGPGGVPIYRGDDGNLYLIDENGNRTLYSPPDGGSAPPPLPDNSFAFTPYGSYNPGAGTIGTYGPPAPNWQGPPVPPAPKSAGSMRTKAKGWW